MPTVSVVIPCYNAEPFIAATIESILQQTTPPLEVLVVDDGSTDRSATVAERFGPPVRVIRQENAGECAARNRGVAEARGDYIAFLDADDLWRPTKLARQLDYFAAHPEVGAVTVGTSVFQDDPNVEIDRAVFPDALLRGKSAAELLALPYVSQSGVMIRADLARAAPYPVGITDSGDMIQVTCLRMLTEIGSVPEPLTLYRRHAAQVTRSSAHHARSLAFRIAWARDHHAMLGAASPEAALRTFAYTEAQRVMGYYWDRKLRLYRSMRRELLRVWPVSDPPPPLLRRMVLPAPILRLKDALDRRMAQRRERAPRARADMSRP